MAKQLSKSHFIFVLILINRYKNILFRVRWSRGAEQPKFFQWNYWYDLRCQIQSLWPVFTVAWLPDSQSLGLEYGEQAHYVHASKFVKECTVDAQLIINFIKFAKSFHHYRKWKSLNSKNPGNQRLNYKPINLVSWQCKFLSSFNLSSSSIQKLFRVILIKNVIYFLLPSKLSAREYLNLRIISSKFRTW